MFKLKLLLYLICSDFIIALNTQLLTTPSTLRGLIGRAGSGRRESISRPIELPDTNDRQDIGIINRLPIKSTVETLTETPIESYVRIRPSELIITNNNTDLMGSTENSNKGQIKSVTETPEQILYRLSLNQATNTTSHSTNENYRVFNVDDATKGKSPADMYDEIEKEVNEYKFPLTNRILIPEESISSRTPVENKFDNQSYLLNAAAHGLYFHHYGRSYIFHDQFDLIVRFDIPKKIELKKTFDKGSCSSFIQDSYVNTNLSQVQQDYKCDDPSAFCGHFPSSRLISICSRLTHYYDKQIEEFQDIVDGSYDKFEKAIRSKRFVITTTVLATIGAGAIAGALTGAVAGGIVGGIAGWLAGGKHDTTQLENSIKDLENKTDRITNSVAINSRILSGLSFSVAEMEKDFKNEMTILSDNTRFQVENLEASIKDINTRISNEMKLEMIVKSAEDYINLHLASLRNTLTLSMENLKDWEEIFTTLKAGRLPRKLIGFNQLKGHLNEIENELKNLFEIAIEKEDFPLLYNMNLVSYNIKPTNDSYALYLHLKIPLKMSRVNNKFNIISVQANSFPCLNNKCYFDGERKENSLQSFDLPQMSFLVHPNTHKIIHEIQLDFLDCQHSSEERICWSYHPTTLHSPSPCTTAIHAWNETEIAEWCNFKQTTHDQYRVVPIKYNQYLIHKDIVKHYSQYCKDDQGEKLYVESWAETLEIGEFCEVFIDATNQRLLGPFSKILRGINYVPKFSYESTLIEKINAKYGNLSQIEVPTLETSRIVRSIEYRIQQNKNASDEFKARMSSEELSKIAIFNIKTQNELKQSMSALKLKYQNYSFKGSLWGYFSLFGHSIQLLTSLTVVFGILSYSNFLGMVACTLVVIQPRAIEAWDIKLIPDIKILPDINLRAVEDTTTIAFFMNIAFVILFIAFSVLFVCYGVFRKVEISQHWAKGFPLEMCSENIFESCPSCLMIHLNYRANFIRCVKVENVHIKLNIDEYFDERVKSIKVKNPLVYWFIAKNNGLLSIQLSESIHLIGFDANNERIIEVNYTVDIPIGSSSFTSQPMSVAIQNKGNNGLALIDTVQKARRGGAGKSNESPPRYVEVYPSSPPMIEEAV